MTLPLPSLWELYSQSSACHSAEKEVPACEQNQLQLLTETRTQMAAPAVQIIVTPPQNRPVPSPNIILLDLEIMNQEQLLAYINQVSFVVSDMLLYLDTHPTDREALAYCEDHIAMRNKALKEYAVLYGPITIDTADDASSECWEWVNTPWPWEGRLK